MFKGLKRVDIYYTRDFPILVCLSSPVIESVGRRGLMYNKVMRKNGDSKERSFVCLPNELYKK